MINFVIGVLHMVLLGDFPGYAVMGVHEDSQTIDWVYQLACAVGHDNMCG